MIPPWRHAGRGAPARVVLAALLAVGAVALAICGVLASPAARADDAGLGADPWPGPTVGADAAVDAPPPPDAAPRPIAPRDAAVDAPPPPDAAPAGLPAPGSDGGRGGGDGGGDHGAGLAGGVDADAAAVAVDRSADAPPAAGADTLSPPTHPPPPAEPQPSITASEGMRTSVVIKLVLGFVLLLAIAYVGGNRKVVAMQERMGLSGVIAAGFPFVALGVIASRPDIGILTPDVVDRIRPILHFGLGWLGFIIGAQLDIRLLDRLPRGTAYLVVVEALAPFAATAAACGAAAIALGLGEWGDATFWRDLVLLGTAAAMTAPRRFRGFANRGWREGRGADALLGQLDEIVGVVGLLFVAAYFRPDVGAGWQIPGTAWVFLTIGLGVAVGALVFAMVRVPVSSGEFLAVVLGSVALGSGLAGYLYLSPIVVCFIAGALVTNFPCEQRDDIFRILNHLERPIHLLFLIVAGAIWDVTALAAWAIVPAFALARIVGKWAGIFAARNTVGSSLPPGFADERMLVSPLSPLSIALVLSLASVGGWIVTAVIAGAILTELAVQLTAPPLARGAVPPPPTDSLVPSASGVPDRPGTPGAIDELDEADRPAGPTYRDDDDDLPPLAPRPRTEGERP